MIIVFKLIQYGYTPPSPHTPPFYPATLPRCSSVS